MLNLFQGDFGTRDTFRFIEEMLDAGTWCWNFESDEMEWSRGFWRLVGLDPGSLQPNFSNLKRALHPDDRQALDDLKQTLRDMVPAAQKFRTLGTNGRIHWSLFRAEPLIDISGNATKAVGVGIDITDVHKMMHSSKINLERYQALRRMINEIVFSADDNGVILQRQKSAPPVHPEKSWWDLYVHSEDVASTRERWKASVEAGQPFLVEHRLLQPDGSFQRSTTRCAPILNLVGNVQEWIMVSRTQSDAELVADAREEAFILTGSQIRAGRAIAGLSVQDLSNISKVSPSSIRRLEEVSGPVPAEEQAHSLIRNALEENGVEFVFSSGKKPGVRPTSQFQR